MKNNVVRTQFAQGDVLLVRAEGLDLSQAQRGPLDKGRVVLAYGEVTGHSHSMTCETVTPYLFEGRTVIVVEEPTPLIHQEHAPIEVTPRVYWVVAQSEYSPAEIRSVRD